MDGLDGLDPAEKPSPLRAPAVLIKPSMPTKYQVRQPKYQVRQPKYQVRQLKFYAVLL